MQTHLKMTAHDKQEDSGSQKPLSIKRIYMKIHCENSTAVTVSFSVCTCAHSFS
jgi:hypothetical protein